MSIENRLAAAERQITALQNEVGRQADVQTIRKLQFAYGYFMDKCLFDEIVELFAENAVLHFMGGVFRGKAGAKRLYGGGSGLNGPVDGMLFEHITAQDIVDVTPDRQTAKARFRCFMQGGVHRTKTDAPPQIPKQFWEAGIYENEYVREAGVWKIKVFNYTVVWQAAYEEGWTNSPVEPLMVSHYEETFPANPRGPDEIGPPPRRWPQAVAVPFHFDHPVTGKPIVIPSPA